MQSESCHTDRCPTGVATQNKWRQRAVVVADKGRRVYHFHERTVAALREVVATAGLDHPGQLRRAHLYRRTSDSKVLSADRSYRFLAKGELLHAAGSGRYQAAWRMAQPGSFLPATAVDEHTP